MDAAWHQQAMDQLSFWWDNTFWPRVQGLTDDEYIWEPVSTCWSVRADPNGGFAMDYEWPPPDPPPLTTIAWRLCHIGGPVFAVRNAAHFGGPAWDTRGRDWPGTAGAALSWVEDGYQRWRAAVRELSVEDLAAPVGPAEGPWSDAPMTGLVLHINREAIHHGAEICLLRDLYRAEAASESSRGCHRPVGGEVRQVTRP
jgi:DinB family protein